MFPFRFLCPSFLLPAQRRLSQGTSISTVRNVLDWLKVKYTQRMGAIKVCGFLNLDFLPIWCRQSRSSVLHSVEDCDSTMERFTWRLWSISGNAYLPEGLTASRFGTSLSVCEVINPFNKVIWRSCFFIVKIKDKKVTY